MPPLFTGANFWSRWWKNPKNFRNASGLAQLQAGCERQIGCDAINGHAGDIDVRLRGGSLQECVLSGPALTTGSATGAAESLKGARQAF
jgi:hypothetical protein